MKNLQTAQEKLTFTKEVVAQRKGPIAQGDILLLPCVLPSDAIKVEPIDGRYTLQRGDTTTHEHMIPQEYADMYEDRLGWKYLVIKENAPLIHTSNPTLPDHWTIRQFPDTYRVHHQYQVISGLIRQITD